ELKREVLQCLVIEVEMPLEHAAGQTSSTLEDGARLVHTSSKLTTPSPPVRGLQRCAPSRTRILYALRPGKTMLVFHLTAQPFSDTSQGACHGWRPSNAPLIHVSNRP